MANRSVSVLGSSSCLIIGDRNKHDLLLDQRRLDTIFAGHVICARMRDYKFSLRPYQCKIQEGQF